MCLVAPVEAEENAGTRRWLETIAAESNPIGDVKFVDVRQSMKNGGGPACLRLRVVLTYEEIEIAHSGVFFDEDLYLALADWGRRRYRDRLRPSDLADPALLRESREALDELTAILGLPSIYPFQQSP
jgi:succinylarginine dihydrolase